MVRAVIAAVAIVTNRKTMPSVVPDAEELEHLDADEDRPDGPGRDAEEEAGVGVLGDEDEEHGELDRADAGLGQVEQGADDAGDRP